MREERSKFEQCANMVGLAISMITWNGKLNLPFEEKMQLRNDYLS